MGTPLQRIYSIFKIDRKKAFRGHFYIFLICCGISLFIWFLIKMSDEYTTEVRIPLQYENVPDDLFLNNSDRIITVRMRAAGGKLFSLKFLSFKKFLTVDLNQVSVKRSRYFDKQYILTAGLEKQIRDRFDFGHEILGMSPDTLFLEMEQVISKSVPVHSRLEMDFSPQFGLYDSLGLIPPVVMVSGPASVIDTITRISTQKKSLKHLDSSVEINLPLVLPVRNKNVTYSVKEIKAIVNVEKYTESGIELPVSGISDDSGLKIRTFPENVTLTYRVAIRDFKDVKPEMFLLTATYDPEKDREKSVLRVRVEKSPDFIRISRINPERVEFIIQK